MGEPGDDVALAETAASDPGRLDTLPAHASPASSIGPGARVARYEIVKRLGAGGMGIVYEARDTELGRLVALKLVKPRGENIEDATARLRREAQTMASLSHPGVVTVHDIGTHGDQLFVAMELATGGTLRDWLHEPRPWREIVARFVAIGHGLAAAHSAGIVHRDFKPENVLVGARGDVRVADFGLARSAGSVSSAGAPSEAATETDPSAMAGTPSYMAPEQFLGQRIDARTDQYSFCVAFYEALEGCRPFGADERSVVALAAAVVDGKMRPWQRAGIPAWLRSAITRGLACSSEERWPSLEALLAQVHRRTTRARAGWAFVAIAAVLAGGGIAVARLRSTPTAEVERWRPKVISHVRADEPRILHISWDRTRTLYLQGTAIWTQRRDTAERSALTVPDGLAVSEGELMRGSPDVVVWGHRDDHWEIWRLGRGAPQLLDRSAKVRKLEIAPDDRGVLLFGGSDQMEEDGMRLLDLATGTERELWVGAVHAAAWSPDGARVAAIVDNGSGRDIVIVDPHSAAKTVAANYPTQEKRPFLLVWPAPSTLVVGRLEGQARVFERRPLEAASHLGAAATVFESLPDQLIDQLWMTRDTIELRVLSRMRRIGLRSRGNVSNLQTRLSTDIRIGGWTRSGEAVIEGELEGVPTIVAVAPGRDPRALERNARVVAIVGDTVWVTDDRKPFSIHRAGSAETVVMPDGEIYCAGWGEPPCLYATSETTDPDREHRLTLHAWDVGTSTLGAVVATITVRGNTGIALSADGKRLAIPQPGYVESLDLSSGKQERLAEDTDFLYQWVAWGFDGSLYATGVELTSANRCRLVRVPSPGATEVLHETPCIQEYIGRPRPSRDGESVAFVRNIWDVTLDEVPLAH